MSFLISLLRHHKLPENLQVSLPLPLPPNNVSLPSQYSYRTSLLVYLLGQSHDQGGDDTTESNSTKLVIMLVILTMFSLEFLYLSSHICWYHYSNLCVLVV